MDRKGSLWRDAYKIGDREIDVQHFQLFREVERLVALTEDDRPELKKKECLSVLKFLITYTENHFQSEEKLQRRINYVDYDLHARLHAQFRQTIMGYKSDIEKKFSDYILKSFIGTLLTWLVTHILSADQKIMKNEPIGVDIALEDEIEYVKHIFEKIFTDLYGIEFRDIKTYMYKGHVEGDIIVRTIVRGKKKFIFLYGISGRLAYEIYTRISGLKMHDISNLDPLEISAFEEIGNIISSNTACLATKSKINEFEYENDVYTDRYTDSKYSTRNASVVKFPTEFGNIEVLCAPLQ